MSTWVKLVLAVLLLLVVTQTVRASKYRAQAEVHREYADSAGSVADSAGAVAAALRAEALSRDSMVERINEEREAERMAAQESFQRSERTIRELRGRIVSATEGLTPEILVVVQPIFDDYESQLGELRGQLATALLEVERETARADSVALWGQGWKDAHDATETETVALRTQVTSLEAAYDALESATDRSWFMLPQPEWWMVGLAGVGGFVLNR